MNLLISVLLPLLLLIAPTLAQSGFCESSVGICAVLSVPQASASSGSGDVTFNITAPSTGWSAVGLGSGMSGSLIFVVYPQASGNGVTVSPRLGSGHVQPQYYADAGITMLEGSRVNGDTLTAIFTCSNCWRWSGGTLNVKSTNRPWIYARNSEQLVSDSPRANIGIHDDNGVTSIDMTKTVSAAASAGDASSVGGSTVNLQQGTAPQGYTRIQKIIIAHGVIMSLVFLILLPLGAMFVRFLARFVPKPVQLHAGWQIFSWLLVLVAFGLGIYISNNNRNHFTTSHQVFGVIIVSAFILQIAGGIMHHSHFKKHQKRSVISHGHIWFGRTLIICGVINAGLGLQLVKAPRKYVVAFSIVAVIVGIVYIIQLVLRAMTNRKERAEKQRAIDGESFGSQRYANSPPYGN